MAFFGGFVRGLNQGMQFNQQMSQQAEEHKLKAKMLEFQMKKMETEQRQDEQQQRGLADYQQAVTQGVPDQFGGPVQGPIEESGRLPAQPAPNRKATPQELFGMSLNAVRPQDAVRLIQQQQKAESLGSVNATFADVESALAFRNSPQFLQAMPQGGRLKQTRAGWIWEAVNPVNIPANRYHEWITQHPGDHTGALNYANQAVYESAASQGAGRNLGDAAATMGMPVPPPPPFTRPQGQPQQAPVGPQGALNLPAEQGAGGTTFRMDPNIPPAEQAAIRRQMGMAQAPAQPAQPGKSLPLQAKQAKADITRESANIPEAASKEIGNLETLLNTTIGDIRKNYDNGAYLGPIKGNETYYGIRRQLGSKIGQPVNDREASFRSALSDAGDMLLRARSGAQINEQEYKRLAGLLPKATDEPQVFLANLDRFENQLKQTLANRKRLENMPRSGIGQSSGASSLPPPPAGWR